MKTSKYVNFKGQVRYVVIRNEQLLFKELRLHERERDASRALASILRS